jgi:hypothetical protein
MAPIPGLTQLLQSICLFTLLVPSLQAQPLRLELTGALQSGTVQLRLLGETNRPYLLEVSTNLTSWQQFAQVQTTNGIATLSFNSAQARYSFLRARTVQAGLSVTPQVAQDFTVSVFVPEGGGEVTLFTPDLRSITLAIPEGALANPTEVRLTLVTNLVGLPFAAGTIATVQIEPEGLALIGAATLTIQTPEGLDTRSIASFTANNDGTGFSLAPNVAETNRIVVPVTDFAMFGSAVATMSEIQSLAALKGVVLDPGQSLRALSDPSIILEICRALHPDDFQVNRDQFPASSSQCFPEMVDRAISVQHELKAFLICDVLDDLAVLLAFQRQRAMLGLQDYSSVIISNTVKRICPIYQEKIEPLWQEAESNCPLGIVLMGFMLGFERQVQMLGMTNLTDCNYTLFGNLDKLCKSAKSCIHDTQGCCFLGYRGQEKYLEISKIVGQMQAVGDTSCFPLGMDDPIVLQALDICLTNAWYGSFQVRYFGDTTEVTHQGNNTTTVRDISDVRFDGSVFASTETPGLPGVQKSISLRVMGTGTVKLDNILDSITRVECIDGGSADNRYIGRTLTTGAFNGTNGVELVWGEYSILLNVKPDNTAYTINAGGPLLRVKVVTDDISSTSGCEGGGHTDHEPPFETTSGALFPMLTPPITRAMGSDTNIISGAEEVIDISGQYPVTTYFSWRFQRVQQR